MPICGKRPALPSFQGSRSQAAVPLDLFWMVEAKQLGVIGEKMLR